MNATSTGFVRNFKIIAEKDGTREEFGDNSRWYAIATAHNLEVQGWTIVDIQKWNKEKGDYIHDVSEPNESKGTPARDSMEVLRERYQAKEKTPVDMKTSNEVGALADLAKTLASQARKGGVEAPILHQFCSEFFAVARRLGVSPQMIMEYSVAQYPELQPRRRQEATA